MFKLPKNEIERQKWIAVIPPRVDFKINPETYLICERHWKPGYSSVKIPGGLTRPNIPPTEFNVPQSCTPSKKYNPRKKTVNIEERQTAHLKKKDGLQDIDRFAPEKILKKLYEDDYSLIVNRSNDRFICLFMDKSFSDVKVSIVVKKKKTLTCSLTLVAFKNGIRVPLGSHLHPNNGLNYKQQFFEAVRIAANYEPVCDSVVKKAVNILKNHSADCCRQNKNVKRIEFLIHQLALVTEKNFSVSDYCFAIESFPNCHYEQLREFLILPSKRKLQSIVASVDLDSVLEKTFKKATTNQQKNAFLLVDEVKIRPTISFAGGVLSGMAKNTEEDSRATSMLCVMMKCLHKGPSVMLSVTPVHRLTASYQYDVVIKAANLVEKAGGTVLGSITDNHKINQQYCKLFTKSGESRAIARHPLNEQRPWFLLFDTVHLLKCVRNNWISEKTKQISLDQQSTVSFADIEEIYKDEKDSIIKMTPLTLASVAPSKLQLQNVQHVLKVFNDKVCAALTLKKREETANFLQTIINWWNVVNVSGKGQDKRLNDPFRSVQTTESTSLDKFIDIFRNASSGHGANRIKCFTHDTKTAMVQTMEGLKAVCDYLLTDGNFQYVVLRELQSDRLEGEFGVYRQSTGASSFMTCGDVFNSSRKRLAKYAASTLESIETESSGQKNHDCLGLDMVLEDAVVMEMCSSDIELTNCEESSAAYVAGWLEKKCANELIFNEDEPVVEGEVKDFIETVSRGKLVVPHVCTYELVRLGHYFVKSARHRACCRNRLIEVLISLCNFNDIDISYRKVFRHLANVLLHGLQNLEKDQQKNAVLLQTAVKRARML